MTTLPKPKSQVSPVLALIGFVVAVALVAVVGGLASSNARDTYGSLNQPSWAPPSWLFGPVWTVLYLMIAVAGWLAWRAHAGRLALGLYGVNLLLNAAWTPLFFGAGQPVWALVDILALDVVVIAVIVAFTRPSRLAASLLIPYLVWSLFATALTIAIVSLN